MRSFKTVALTSCTIAVGPVSAAYPKYAEVYAASQILIYGEISKIINKIGVNKTFIVIIFRLTLPFDHR